MKSYKAEIEDLFSSTGEFAIEWKRYLDKVELKNQKDFLEQLHQNVLTERSLRSLFEKEFGVGDKDNPPQFRYSKIDYDAAKKSEPLHSEKLIEEISEEPDARIKYRATAIFHERKIQEIQNERTEIERLLLRLTKSDSSQKLYQHSDRTRHLFHDEELPLIELPPHFSKSDLTALLRSIEIAKGFNSDADFQLFKSNSFALLSVKDSISPVSIEVADRGYLAKKMQEIYEVFKKEKSDYPDLNLSRRIYAVALLANISNYQNSKTTESTFRSKLNVILGEMR